MDRDKEFSPLCGCQGRSLHIYTYIYIYNLFFRHLLQADNSVVELITQYVEYQRADESALMTVKDLEVALDEALSQVTQLQVDLKAEKTARSEADKELADLCLKAKELEEVRAKNGDLVLALKTTKDETAAAVEGAKAEVDRLALADFKKSEEYIGLLGERYNGGWVSAKRCVCHSHPNFNWEQMETAFGKGVNPCPLADEPFI